VLVPVRNEVQAIGQTLDCILAQTFPAHRMEILVLDGGSEDGTRHVVEHYARTVSHLRLLDNPAGAIPVGLNLGIAASNGDVIVRVDGRCRIAPDYVERCVELLASSLAANVGGPVRAEGVGLVGQAIALAMRSRFGAGNSRYHYLERDELVDTVYLGAFRREVLSEVGGYDNELRRNQDDELNYRIRLAGYGILLSPSVMSLYTPPSSLAGLCRGQYYAYGYWKIRVLEKHPRSLQPRQLAPPALVCILTLSLLSSVIARRKSWLAPGGLYGASLLAVAGWVARTRLRLTPLVAAAFACMHLGYGVGFLRALAGSRWKKGMERFFDHRTTPTIDQVRRCRPLDASRARVSVLVPVRNEVQNICLTLDCVLAQTIPPHRMEILVLDGRSEDGTRQVVEQYERTVSNLRLVDNPCRTIPAGMNLGIAQSLGDVIVRVDGRCSIAPDYVERCVEVLASTRTANVGGAVRAEGVGAVGQAIATAMRSRIGVGNSRYHYLEHEELVDTVYMGAFRREVLEELGGYDEDMVCNEDDELNFRIREAGYGVLLSPNIVSLYTPAQSWGRLWRKQFYLYGYWRVRVATKHPGSLQPRQLAPPALVALLAYSMARLMRTRRVVWLLPVGLYGGAVLAASSWIARPRFRSTPLVATALAFMHLGYGAGFWRALLDLALSPARWWPGSWRDQPSVERGCRTLEGRSSCTRE
jgi:glycosyltransferase involved in cell wall biosynthesis